MGFQMWLFLWAPNNGSSLSVSFGYLLLPIVMVAAGRVFLKNAFQHSNLLPLSLQH